MGQHPSKHHAPLTFAYVNDAADEEVVDDETLNENINVSDFVLANPHLYKLEMVCQNNCAERRKCPDDSSEASSKPKGHERTPSVIVATQVDQECEFCRQNKRLSLVRRDLAKDLAYIDETYYPDVIHYVTNDDVPDSELLGLDVEDDSETENENEENWSKLTIGEIAPRKTRSRRLTNPSLAVDLSGRSLVKLSPSIGYLNNLTKLNLSNNKMTSLPRTLGYLKNLRVLNVSHNQLETVPDTIAFLSKLVALNVAHNNMTALPSAIGLLPKLAVLIVNDNKLTSIPREVANLQGLISLNVSNNPLRVLPAEIGTLKSLQKLTADGCEFESEFTHQLKHDPPSLFEYCARAAVRAEMPIPAHISEHIKEYLAQVQTCSFCGGPYFQSYVTRGRFIERTARQQIALEYKLCVAHWNTEDERRMAMFCETPITAPRRSQGKNAVDTDGLDEQTSPPRRFFARNRAYSDTSNRTYSGSPLLSLSPSTSSQVSQRSSSNTSLGTHYASSQFLDSTESFTIQSLKKQPSLPALPSPTLSSNAANGVPRSSSSLAPQPKQRPRASSSASITKRIANFLSSSPSTSFTRSASSSALRRQQHWTVEESNHPRMFQIDENDHVEETETGSNNNDELVSSSRRSVRLWMSGQTSSEVSISTGEGQQPESEEAAQQGRILQKPTATNVLRARFAHLGVRLGARERSGTL